MSDLDMPPPAAPTEYGALFTNDAAIDNDATVVNALTDEPASPTDEPAPANLRATLLAQFERWLDETLDAQSPPPGLPDDLLDPTPPDNDDEAADDRDCDLYTLFSALTALTGEIGLQGRAFKQLTTTLAPLAQTPELLAALEESQRASEAAILDAIAQPADDEPAVAMDTLCEVMIDLADRLSRGLQVSAQAIETLRADQRRGLLWRLAGGRAFSDQTVRTAQALRDASLLTLARLQAAMQDWGIQRIGEVGETFDPQRMSVVDVRATNDQPPGVVVEVVRSGYSLNGILKAVARVAVSKST